MNSTMSPLKKILNWIIVEASIYVKPEKPWGWRTHIMVEPRLKSMFPEGRPIPARIRLKCENFSRFKRWFYGTFSFLIPGWPFLKVGVRNLKNRIYLLYFLKTWPLLMLGLMSWSLGKCVGYLIGPLPPERGASSKMEKLIDGKE